MKYVEKVILLAALSIMAGHYNLPMLNRTTSKFYKLLRLLSIKMKPQLCNQFLRQEKYTGIYRVNDIANDKIYPPIVPIKIYEIVREKIEKNKYGKGAKQNHSYLLKGKMFCGCCGTRMRAYGGTSKSGKLHRYYKC